MSAKSFLVCDGIAPLKFIAAVRRDKTTHDQCLIVLLRLVTVRTHQLGERIHIDWRNRHGRVSLKHGRSDGRFQHEPTPEIDTMGEMDGPSDDPERRGKRT
jgi:hypothetical protein